MAFARLRKRVSPLNGLGEWQHSFPSSVMRVISDPTRLFSQERRGREAVHAVRKFIGNKIYSLDHKVKLDMKNAFNSVRRDHILQTCLDRTPEIANVAFLAYSKSSSVSASGHSITSSSGVQQCDPIGPLLSHSL